MSHRAVQNPQILSPRGLSQKKSKIVIRGGCVPSFLQDFSSFPAFAVYKAIMSYTQREFKKTSTDPVVLWCKGQSFTYNTTVLHFARTPESSGCVCVSLEMQKNSYNQTRAT
ncbi:hypothetical protein AVEN_93608-1 [Araneus ventricosus]|uniref:Uncharacterized protein n=1 Tax=Araneus ventricosus TaxID=182803 RepID=A0A4Y2T759_ARAVE|nr:hypothetical protein AVEN_93608-1 [Araneus ventricosus]